MKRGLAVLLGVVLLVGGTTWLLAPVFRQTAGTVREEVEAQAPAGAAARTPEGAAVPPRREAAEAWTETRLEAWLRENPTAWLSMWALKLGMVLLGGVMLVLELLRLDRERHGLLPAPDGRGPTAVAAPLSALGLAILAPLAVQVAAAALVPPPEAAGSYGFAYGMIVTAASFLPPAVLVVLRRFRLGAGPIPGAGTALVTGLRYACIATLVVLPVHILWAWALLERGVRPEVQDVVRQFAQPDSPAHPWLVGAFGALVAPFTEEALFRGLLYPALRARVRGGPLVAAVLVSLLFAAVHANLFAFVPLFVLALVLTWVMERTNSLLACVCVHALYNLSSILPMLLRHAMGATP